MASKRGWKTIAAQIVYNAYPDSDLLPIDPPVAGETIAEFSGRAENAGDTLFLFLCRERLDVLAAKNRRNSMRHATLGGRAPNPR